jgi:hypothetical protein
VKEYEISVPVIAHVTVEAESEQEAIQKALDTAGPNDVDAWYNHRTVVVGNSFHGPLNRVRVDNVFDTEEG